MPAKSEAQRRFLYATKGVKWVKAHHFDTKGPLPEHVGKGKGKGKMKKHHTGALHRGHGHMHTKHPGGKLHAHSTHGKMNRSHGTPAGFSPGADSHRKGEATSSHLGKNCEMC